MKQAKGRVVQQAFYGPNLKVHRAYAHVQALIECLHAYLGSNFYSPFVNQQIEEGRIKSGVGIRVKPLPEVAPLIIGDIVHNLRTALDHVIVNIVRSAGSKPSNYLVFPFAQTKEELIRTGRMKEIKEAALDIYELIIDDIKPYESGNNYLWGLNKLDVADKHRLIVPVVHMTALPGICAVDEDGVERVRDCEIQVGGSGFMTGLTLGGKLRIKSHGTPRVQILFGHADAFARKPVVETLIQLGKAVSDTLEILAAYLLGESAAKGRDGSTATT